MNINDLLAAIRAWQAAHEAYLAAVAESPDRTSPRRSNTCFAMDTAARVLTGRTHDSTAFAAFVALADEVERLQKESRNNMLAESQQQAKDDDAIEAKLRKMFAAARFPEVEDVYVSTGYSAYVTFKWVLRDDQVVMANLAMDLNIERSDPRLRNRYRVTFIAPDQEYQR